MRQETIEKAVQVINQHIRFYQRKLTYQLELKAETILCNSNLAGANSSRRDLKIKKYEIILADLATIKRSIKMDKTTFRILGTAENRSMIYSETLKAIKKAGFLVDGDEYGTLYLSPLDED